MILQATKLTQDWLSSSKEWQSYSGSVLKGGAYRELNVSEVGDLLKVYRKYITQNLLKSV